MFFKGNIHLKKNDQIVITLKIKFIVKLSFVSKIQFYEKKFYYLLTI